jgi:glycine cleavage system T protein (aminomethyltransferase)
MNGSLHRTPLYAAHHDAGAKLVDFAGWEMPLHYGSQIEEHHAVRRDAGMFDTSHMLPIDVEGAEARALLRYALANNVDKLRAPGAALYSCLLREDGGILDDLIVYLLDDVRFRVVVNAATADKDHTWLDSVRGRHSPKVALRPRRDLAMIAAQGPNARAKVWAALPGTRAASESLATFTATTAGELFVARTGYTGEDGFELLVPAPRAEEAWKALAAQGVRPCGLAARDTLRLEAGMNLYGQDMDEDVTPLESGLGWTVDLKSPRDFIGKLALASRTPQRKLVGLVLVERGGVLRAHQVVRTSHGDGEITSGTFSPTLQQSIALARLPGGVVPGDEVEVTVRDKHLRARVVRPPFVRHGKVLVNTHD